MRCEAVLADPRNVVGIWLFFQSTLDHVPAQQPLAKQQRVKASSPIP